MFDCQFRGRTIIVTHSQEGHEYGFYVRAPGDVVWQSQRTGDLNARHNATSFAGDALDAAKRFSVSANFVSANNAVE